MKGQLRLRKDEPLNEWLDRIADYWHFGTELREMLGEISQESFDRGRKESIIG